MKTRHRLLASFLCLLMIASCVSQTVACGVHNECSHQWEEWTITRKATCTKEGAKERECSECGETETAVINALGHDWEDATCFTPKTCKTCSETEGTVADHAYTVKSVKEAALKSAASCASAAVYYKSCSCGAISTNDEDTFTRGEALEHQDSNTDHICDYCGDTNVGAHEDSENDGDHICDYGCGVTIESCSDKENDGNHDCDICGRANVSTHKYGSAACGTLATCSECGETAEVVIDHKDENKDHACDYNCGKDDMGDHVDENKDHACDYGCSDPIGEHADGDDNDHLCDYGCGAIADDGCYDPTGEGRCPECGSAVDHMCVDNNKDHACDGGCDKVFGTCEDADFDHNCDYGCAKVLGDCEDTNKDHECDHGCGKEFGEHFDSQTDNDHLCDYGCGAIIEDCFDAANDGDHNCDVCGQADITACNYGSATCGAPANCFECGATKGSTIQHKDDNFDHICDNKCGKNDMGIHADSDTDNDHVCDYGCGAILEKCSDVDTDDDHNCDICNKANVTSHSYVENAALATEATCEAAATRTYECNCHSTYTESDGDALGHNIVGVTPTEKHVSDVSDCEHVMVYVCQRCHKEVLGATVYHHNYVASISTAATCSADGEKTFECGTCGDTITVIIPKDATGHRWEIGDADENGKRTDTCSICHKTKTVIASGSNSASSSASDLANTDVQLKVDEDTNANIQLGQGVADAIGNKNITISAGVVDEDTLKDMGVSNEQLGQIGDNTVYDFNIKDENGTPISNFGENNFVTITLPYALAEGEDVDSIAVWFIGDACQVEDCDKGEHCVDAHKLVSIEATYNNGFVTFQTNHFSIYTVTRLTPAERCDLYGHSFSKQHVEGSCTKDGYDLCVCVRCHEKRIENLVEADGHNYVSVTQEATCTEDGYIRYDCEDCDHYYTTKLSATGHAWHVIDSKKASCVEDGYTKYKCDNCDEEYTETYAKLEHVYTDTVVPATCTADGYTLHDCDNCDYSYTDSYVDALGHNYGAGEWTWEANGNKATLTLVCEHDTTHTTALHVISDMKKEVSKGACSNYVIRTHTATVEYNGVTYTDVMIIRQGNPVHKFPEEWTVNEDEHWHECICGEKTDVAEHTFGEATITKNPTCKDEGESTAYCSVCGEPKVSTLPVIDEHNYVDGFCDTCGKEQVDCDHTELHRESFDFGALGACGDWILYYDTCECGKVKVLDTSSDIACNWDYFDVNEYVDENGSVVQVFNGVCHCGLEIEAYATCTEDGCTEFYEYNYVFKFNGESVIDLGYTEANTRHSYVQYTYISLDEYGACGGLIAVSQCNDCGAIVDVHDYFDIYCDAEFEDEDIIDENGVAHHIQKLECSDCGLKFIVDVWHEALSACATNRYMTITVTCGEATIIDFQECSYYDEHECEYIYELQGETCTDGVLVTERCKKCESEHSWTYHYHDTSITETIDLTECGACYGVFTSYSCACGQEKHFNIDYTCFDTWTSDEYYDEEGRRIYVEVRTCYECGLTQTRSCYTLKESADCTYTDYYTVTLEIGESLIAKVEYTQSWESHDYETTGTLINGEGSSCYDGVLVTYKCKDCGDEQSWNTYYHHTFKTERIDLSEHGACSGEFYTYSCACGQEQGYNINNTCFDTRTSNEYYDDEGRLVHVNVRTCYECGLRYTYSYYTERDSETCTEVYYYTVVINIGNSLITEYEYTRTEESHDYEITGSLINGEGSSCYDGVLVTEKCKDCGYEYSWNTYGHAIFETERIDLSEHGSVCGGYASVYACACGQQVSLSLDHSLCELGNEWCQLWIEDAITKGQYAVNGWNDMWYESYLYTCAVTDPEDAACAYKIRCAYYWLKDESSCMAYSYATWQFGYNEETGECEYEITFKTGGRTIYHNYVDSITSDSTQYSKKYDCSDCGSYYYSNRYYDEHGNTAKYEVFASNTEDNGYDKYYEFIREYVTDADGYRYEGREYTKYIYADGTEYWDEYLRTEHAYVGPFGDGGREGISSYANSNGNSHSEEYAYVWYKGYEFSIYTHRVEGDYWYRYDYTYTFDNGCVQKEVYTNSSGENSEYTYDICRFYHCETIKHPTCSQDGERYDVCITCGKCADPYTVSPNDHNWVQIAENWYYCFTCGLENANGVSGDIIMEDLTEAYGNGEYYVVGYYAGNNVAFTQYISLILADGSEIIVEGVELITIDGIRAYAFSKSAVDQWAAENGYTDYEVRFSFVPEGSDGSFDYGVTFAESTVVTDTISGNVSFVDYISEGETKYYTITPVEDGVWTFTSASDSDTYGYLYDADGYYLASDDDSGYGNNFNMTYELKAGETYTVAIRWYSSNQAGNMAILFGYQAVSAE